MHVTTERHKENSAECLTGTVSNIAPPRQSQVEVPGACFLKLLYYGLDAKSPHLAGAEYPGHLGDAQMFKPAFQLKVLTKKTFPQRRSLRDDHKILGMVKVVPHPPKGGQ